MSAAEPDNGNELLTTKQVAAWLNVANKTMDTWAMEGRGPDYTKAGRRRRYRRRDVQAYLDANMVRHG